MKKQIPDRFCKTFGEGGEIVRMPPEVADGVVVCYNYLDEIDTPRQQGFPGALHQALRHRLGRARSAISQRLELPQGVMLSGPRRSGRPVG